MELKKKLAVLSILVGAVATNVVSFTMASFVGTKPIGNYTIGAAGKRNFDTVFLNPGTWNTGTGNEDFVVFLWKDGLPNKWITPVRIQQNGYYTFQLDMNYYTDNSTTFFLFVRMNPSRAGNEFSYDVSWNKTYNLNKSGYSSNNVYSITGWGTEKFCGEDKSNTISTGDWNLNVVNS